MLVTILTIWPNQAGGYGPTDIPITKSYDNGIPDTRYFEGRRGHSVNLGHNMIIGNDNIRQYRYYYEPNEGSGLSIRKSLNSFNGHLENQQDGDPFGYQNIASRLRTGSQVVLWGYGRDSNFVNRDGAYIDSATQSSDISRREYRTRTISTFGYAPDGAPNGPLGYIGKGSREFKHENFRWDSDQSRVVIAAMGVRNISDFGERRLNVSNRQGLELLSFFDSVTARGKSGYGFELRAGATDGNVFGGQSWGPLDNGNDYRSRGATRFLARGDGTTQLFSGYDYSSVKLTLDSDTSTFHNQLYVGNLKVDSATIVSLASGVGLDSATSISLAQGVSINNVVEDTTPQLGGDLETNSNDIKFADNDKAIFGAGSDLQIYHDGTQSVIQDVGTGQLKILGENTIHIGSATNNHSYIRALKSGAVDLYHNNSAKLATTSTGINVTGNIVLSGTVDGRDVLTDGTKLDTIDSNADVTPSWVPSSDPSYLTSADGGNADTVDSLHASSFLRSDSSDTMAGNLIIDNGTSSTLSVISDDAGASTIAAYGGAQGTGVIYVGQSGSYGGGIEYNGDNSPTTLGLSDYIALFRRDAGTDTWTARNSYANNNWEFRGAVETGGNIQLDASNAEVNIKSGGAGTSGAVNWTFNTDDTNYASLKLPYDTRATTGFHMDVGYPITIDATTQINFNIAGVNKGTLNSSGNLALTGTSHTASGNTIWHAGNDGDSSGLDADLLDGQHGTHYRINVYNASGTLLN
jgi:hypothetical protein